MRLFYTLPAIILFASCNTKKIALVKYNGKFGFLNQKNKFVIEPIYDDAWSFNEGLAPVKIDGK